MSLAVVTTLPPLAKTLSVRFFPNPSELPVINQTFAIVSEFVMSCVFLI